MRTSAAPRTLGDSVADFLGQRMGFRLVVPPSI